MEESQKRHIERIKGDFGLESASDLKLEWDALAKQYRGSLCGEEVYLTKNAYASACTIIGSNPSYFKGFADQDEFPRQFAKVLDNGSFAKKSLKAVVRTSVNSFGHRQIDAILPAGYQVLDDAQILGPVAEAIEHRGHQIHGVVVEGNDRDRNIRLLFDEPLANPKVVGLDKSDVIVSTFHIHNQELGTEAGVCLGNWRSHCSNTALASLRQKSLMPGKVGFEGLWNHRSRPERFFRRIKEIADQADRYPVLVGGRFTTAMSTVMNADPLVLTGWFCRRHFLPPQVKMLLERQLASEAVKTEWDYINVMTYVAQRMESRNRRRTEAAAHLILLNGIERIVSFMEASTENAPFGVSVEADSVDVN